MYSHKKTHINGSPICHFSGHPQELGRLRRTGAATSALSALWGPAAGLAAPREPSPAAGFAPDLPVTLSFFSPCPAGAAVASGSTTWFSQHPAPLSAPTAAHLQPPPFPWRPRPSSLITLGLSGCPTWTARGWGDPVRPPAWLPPGHCLSSRGPLV